ncbi:hypothetical protein CTI12_AA392580 [Artemisia annua]|uniref:RNA-directed DNA polymerase, eukaryota, Reverse transcriptase zinc-binding domain protein n=1 Tax=Artemisia annua TaxID=35608 RepID=A0A2U1MD25_ARTAN|nr:hypothetical protein CTI12_AA392580 [Artemisia annua]
MGDFNVTMKTSEHSVDGHSMTNDMQDFYDCANGLEIEDLSTTGFHFTWTKSLKNPTSSILKKLNRMMINDGFRWSFKKLMGCFSLL